jgi:hypothetical protein
MRAFLPPLVPLLLVDECARSNLRRRRRRRRRPRRRAASRAPHLEREEGSLGREKEAPHRDTTTPKGEEEEKEEEEEGHLA